MMHLMTDADTAVTGRDSVDPVPKNKGKLMAPLDMRGLAAGKQPQKMG